MATAGTALENPFSGMKISSWEHLKQIKDRSPCTKCGKSRKFYCYSCYELVNLSPDAIPNLKLPVKIDIIKHRLEVDGKSTASHAKILAPSSVNIYEFPNVPDYSQKSKVVMCYPLEASYTCEELVTVLLDNDSIVKRNTSAWCCIDTIVFIDSTWYQTHQILQHENLKSLPCVKLTEAKTCFWRPQHKTASHLATIESIYYVLKQLDSLITTKEYEGQYDDLLYFFSYQYTLIQLKKTL